MRLPLILDIDLDYFVDPIRRGRADSEGHDRPPSDKCTVRPIAEVKQFLKQRCHLSKVAPAPGRACEYHREIYHHLDRLIIDGKLQPPFNFIHIDAHDDLGGPTNTDDVHSANFLLQCIKRDWIDYLVLVLPPTEWTLPTLILSADYRHIEFDSHKAALRCLPEYKLALPISPDFCFVTRSPDFTPKSADAVFDLITSYTSA